LQNVAFLIRGETMTATKTIIGFKSERGSENLPEYPDKFLQEKPSFELIDENNLSK
jgi:hypothetical protein